MPKSRTTWSQDEIEGLVREYLKRSGLRPIEVDLPQVEQRTQAQTDVTNGNPKKRRVPKTFQWGFKPRISISTEVEPDPDFSEDEYVCRCQRCGQVVVSTRPPVFRDSNNESNVDESNSGVRDVDAADAAPALMDTNLLPPGSAEAIRRAQEAKEEKQLRELHKKRQKVRGESDDRPY